jgi:WD40 repeat protein
MIALDWSPDGRWISAVYVVDLPNSKFSFSIWATESGELVTRRPLGSHGFGVFWSPDGTRLAITGQETIIFDTPVSGADKPPTTPFKAIETPLFHDKNLISPSSFAWSPDGKQFALSTKTSAFVFNLETGQKKFSFSENQQNATSVAWSPRGSLIATAGPGDVIKLWDAETGAEQLTLRGHTANVTGIAWNSDGSQLVSGGRDGIKIWDPHSRPSHTASLLSETCYETNISPDGKLCSVQMEDGGLRIYRTADWALSQTILASKGLPKFLSHTWSPDNTRIAVVEIRHLLSIYDVR